jgi:hypothetical protein
MQNGFDRITRAIAGGASRREVLKIALGTAATALFGVAMTEQIGAQTSPTCVAQCGPCQSCRVVNGRATCVSNCNRCQICDNRRNVCIRRCDACSTCSDNPTDPPAIRGVCRSTCTKCQACAPNAAYGGPTSYYGSVVGVCVSRCGPGRECIDGQCVEPRRAA